MSATQLSFSLRVSSGVKSVHLLGSWDNYSGQLPLSKDKSSSKSGSWKGTFRFNGTLKTGQRYWYYYIIDGYHVAHNPSVDSTVEPTTGRALNILDMPKSSSGKSSSSSKKSSSRRSSSNDIPKGRPLSVSQIKAPKPVSPNATRTILDYDEEVEELTSRFSGVDVDSDDDSELSYRSSPSSSVSGYSTPASDCSSCSCERYGITRKGDRVLLDCGGARCGDEYSSCSDSDEEYIQTSSRRNGVVMRN
ncbi:related to SRP40 Suppressor of mutant AC40 of RNA polymerase I and III [Cephalotrichum gorgonifer]|uniref:Related to SRP40 Suppressor of mutant AC40 of RNA polymerase I and III n=1 Tax=Cephalotrichum gorgonifer TaxID=2041049 RepID=A0AAE8SR46_9PEZI|nr:related to SRP40 Suppressor of mutant AC40 of RNA polymerase I and III [Cephalotrichum gorgonifer]